MMATAKGRTPNSQQNPGINLADRMESSMVTKNLNRIQVFFKLFSFIFMIFILVLTSACRGSSSQQSPSSTISTIGPSKTGSVSTSGGTVEMPGIKVVFPSNALNQTQNVTLQNISSPPSPANTNQSLISQAFSVKADQDVFAKPITITLSFDKSKLSPGATGEDVYPAIAAGNLYERIKPDSVDLDTGTVVFTCDRTTPLINTADQPTPVTTYFLVASDINKMVELEKTDKYQFLAPGVGNLKQKAQTLVTPIENEMNEVRTKFNGLTNPGFLYIYLVPLQKGYSGFASGSNTITIDLNSWTAADFPSPGLAHEYFHLIQQIAKQANLQNVRDHGWVLPPRTTDDAWFTEASADFMAMKAFPASVAVGGNWTHKISGLPLNYTYVSLFDYTWPVDGAPLPHQYQSFVFLTYLDTLYDASDLVFQFYKNFLNRYDPGTGEPSVGIVYNSRVLLDDLLFKSTDRLGRKRGLSDNYKDFVVSYNVTKDFEPFKSSYNAATLGAIGEIKPPIEAATNWSLLVNWSIPEGNSGSRVNTKSSGVVFGDRFSVIRAYDITNNTSAQLNEKGDLQLNLQVKDANKAQPVAFAVFPYKEKDKPGSDVMLGDPNNPVTIISWDSYGGAMVLLIDTSPTGDTDMELRAEFKSGSAATPTPTVSFELKTHTEYYPGTQQVMLEYTYYERNGIEYIHGTCKRYYATGEVQSVTNFKYGQEDGVTQEYYQNGQLSREYTIKIGVFDGLEKTYYPNGQLKYERIYKDGKFIPGTEKNYNEDGSLRSTN
jgi:hypothetical protein